MNTARVLCASPCDVPGPDSNSPALLATVVHEMSESFGRAIDAKDPFTKHHSDEVAVIARSLALAMGLSARQADVVHIAGHLHDVGKIGIPDRVLLKPGPLTEAEWRLVRTHPRVGAEILSPVESMERMGVPDMVRGHHERYDGAGYPLGLSGDAIPLGARIIAVADAVSAMRQRRPYRDALDFGIVMERIQLSSGAQFDPRVVEAFTSVSASVEGAVRRAPLSARPTGAVDARPPSP